MDINSCDLFRIFLRDSGVDSGVLLGIITDENEFLIGKCFNHPHNQKKFSRMACFPRFKQLGPFFELAQKKCSFGKTVATEGFQQIIIQDRKGVVWGQKVEESVELG